MTVSLVKGLSAVDISLKLGDKLVLDGATLAVVPGEIIGLIGPNGAGKTSLLKVILGLHETQGGGISLDGIDLNTLSLKERAKRLAYAAQGAEVHWPLCVERIVGLGRLPHLTPWQTLGVADQSAIELALEKTDCLDLKDRVVTTLSGGERARVLLARALASGAEYLLVDEPTASLDPYHQLEVMSILKNHAHSGAETGIGATIVVLHDLGLAHRFCDKLALLDKGKLVGFDTPENILTAENLSDVFDISAARWHQGDDTFIVPIKN
jgi:iron complex transport system ATP-binding protein